VILKVYVKIQEGNKERIQMFEGTVIKKQNGGLRETFTVRRVALGTGVERTFTMNEIIRAIEAEQIRTDLPKFRVGDNVKVYVKVKEGTRERIQMFEGTVIKKQNGGLRETFTVRRVALGTGVERTFPMNAPIIEKIEISRKGKVRRAKLYYLRDRLGKSAKVKELLTR
jgi:large subunit ribosomal protein L19